jgi:hypothetical protein
MMIRMNKRLSIFGGILLAVTLLVWLALPLTKLDRKEDRVRVQLELVSASLRDYAGKNHKLPIGSDGLQVLVADRYFNASAVVDAWGQPLRYSCVDSTCRKAMVWSKGPDGSDNSGKGDDIVAFIDISDVP